MAIPAWPRCARRSSRRHRGSRRTARPWRLLRAASGVDRAARHVPGKRGAARSRRCRRLSGAQPFRGAGLPGVRRRPPHDQRLAQPGRRRHARGRSAPWNDRPEGEAIAVGVSVPLLLRGPAPVANWAPHGFAQPAPDLYAAIAALNQGDPIIGPAIAEGLRARGFSAAVIDGQQEPRERDGFSDPRTLRRGYVAGT